jgi:hypothetical protein
MASEIDIVNEAFLALGHSPITSLLDGSNASILAKALYPRERDAALRAHPWGFAKTRAIITADTTGPLFGNFSLQFQMPENPYCLRVLSIGDDPEIDYKIEGRKILCDETTCDLLFIARMEDPAVYDALFSSTLAMRMAAKMAFAVTGSASTAQDMWKLYLNFIREAKSINGQENPLDPFVANDLIDVR